VKYVDEFESFVALIEFNKMKSQWVSTANKRIANLEKAYNNWPVWQKKKAFFLLSNKYALFGTSCQKRTTRN